MQGRNGDEEKGGGCGRFQRWSRTLTVQYRQLTLTKVRGSQMVAVTRARSGKGLEESVYGMRLSL